LKDEDQDVDLPDFRDEGQKHRRHRTDQIEADQHRTARESLGKGSRDRGDADIGDHLDRQRGSEDHPGLAAGQLECEQPQRHRRQARAYQCDHLGHEQVAVGPV
jgi:hypothetical protein